MQGLDIVASAVQLHLPVCLYRSDNPKNNTPRTLKGTSLEKILKAETIGIPEVDKLPFFLINIASWIITNKGIIIIIIKK